MRLRSLAPALLGVLSLASPSPAEIAIDPGGSLYVVDMLNDRVEKFGDHPVGARSVSWGRIKADLP